MQKLTSLTINSSGQQETAVQGYLHSKFLGGYQIPSTWLNRKSCTERERSGKCTRMAYGIRHPMEKNQVNDDREYGSMARKKEKLVVYQSIREHMYILIKPRLTL